LFALASAAFNQRYHQSPKEGIVIVSLNIRNSEHLHQTFRCYPQNLFGLALPYADDCAYSGLLAQGENLFICAHGGREDIGEPKSNKRFSAPALASWIKQCVLPCHYGGDIHIAAPGSSPAYIDQLLASMGDEYHGRIWGVFNLSYNQLAPPGGQEWIAAVPKAIDRLPKKRPASASGGQRKSTSDSAAR
jgi:hypothetical protein